MTYNPTMEPIIEVPQSLWEDILHVLEFDVTEGFKAGVMEKIRQHFNGVDDD